MEGVQLKAQLLIFTVVVLGFGSAHAAPSDPPLSDLRLQAELYEKRGHLAQARRTLMKAYSLPGGREDFGVVYQRARVAEAENAVAEAFRFGGEALQLGASESQRREATELLERLGASFGYVEVYAAVGEARRRGTIELSSSTVHINPLKKKQFAAAVKGLKTGGIEVPSRIYLPYGDYLANNVAFSIVEGKAAPKIEVFLLDADIEEAGDKHLWWYVGIGGLVALATGAAALILSREERASREVEVRVRLSSLTGQE